MFERFTPEARGVLTQAQAEAKELGHNFIGTEHVLLGLSGTGADAILGSLGTSMAALRAAVVASVGRGTGEGTGSPPFTARAKKALELSLREALARNDTAIRPEHLLLGLLREGEGVGARVLADAGVNYQSVADLVGPIVAETRRRFWRRGLGGGPVYLGDATAGATALPALARTWAGSEPIGTHHYLLALVHEERGLAAKVLAALGVTRQAVIEKIDELGPDGTSDAAQVTVDIGGDSFTVSPQQADDLRRWLRGDTPAPPAA